MSGLVQKFAKMLPERRVYLLRHLASILANKGDTAHLERLLYDFNYGAVKLHYCSSEELEADFRLLDEPLCTAILAVLSKVGNALNNNPTEFPSQILGRIQSQPKGPIDVYLKQAAGWRHCPWIKPSHASFEKPTTHLLRTIKASEHCVLQFVGNYCVAVSSFEGITVFDAATGEQLSEVPYDGEIEEGKWIVVPPCENAVIICDGENITLFSLPNLEVIGTYIRQSEGYINRLATLNYGETLVGVGSNSIEKWDIATQQKLECVENKFDDGYLVPLELCGREIYACRPSCFLRDDRTVFPIVIRDANTFEEVARLDRHSEFIYHILLTPDERHLVTCGQDSTIKVWDTKTWALLHDLHGHSLAVESLALWWNKRYLISGSGDSSIRVWSLDDGSEITSLDEHNLFVGSLTCSSDGTLASSSGDGTIRIWNIAGVTKRNGKVERKVHDKSQVTSVSNATHVNLSLSGASNDTVAIHKLIDERPVPLIAFYIPSGGGQHEFNPTMHELFQRKVISGFENNKECGILSCAFSTDMKSFALGTAAGTLIEGSFQRIPTLVDVVTRNIQPTFTRFRITDRFLFGVCWTETSESIIAVSDGGELFRIDSKTKNVMSVQLGTQSAQAQIISLDNWIFCAIGSTVFQLDSSSLEIVGEVCPIDGNLVALDSDCHGRIHAISKTLDHIIFDTTLEEVERNSLPQEKTIGQLAATSTDGSIILICNRESVRLWDCERGHYVARLTLDEYVTSCVANGESSFVVGSSNGGVHWVELIDEDSGLDFSLREKVFGYNTSNQI